MEGSDSGGLVPQSKGMATRVRKEKSKFANEGNTTTPSSGIFSMRQALKSATKKSGSTARGNDTESRLQKEIETLEIKAKRREAEFSKVKAVLEQKLELTELQLVETKNDMESQKNMYNSMLKALQNKSENSTYEQQLESIKEMQRKQDGEVAEIRQKYEKQLTDLKERINMQELNEKSLKSQLRQQKAELKQDLTEKEKTINDLKIKHQKILKEKDKQIDKLSEELDKMQEKHLAEVKDLIEGRDTDESQLKEEYETKLADLKYLNEQEVLSLKNQIRLLEEELTLLRQEEPSFEVARDSEFQPNNDRVKVLDIRLSEINDKFADDMLASEKEIARLNREIDELQNKLEREKVAHERLKDTMNTRLEEKDLKYNKLKDKFNEKCTELHKTQKKIKDTLNLKKRISDLKLKVSKLEAIKRDLKESLKAKSNELETERASKQRAVLAERKKTKMKGDQLNQMKREVNLKSSELESLKQDQLNQSIYSDSRYYSPRALGRGIKRDYDVMSNDPRTNYTSGKVGLDSLNDSNMNMTNNPNETYSGKKARRMKSSSPNRNIMMSTQRIRVGGLGRNRSARRLIQITTEHLSQVGEDHDRHCGGAHKYCEACKYKTWRIQQLKYDPEKLLNSRDMIRYITCLGCDKSFEVKPFLKHIRDCRLSNHVPLIDGFKYWKKSDFKSDYEEDDSNESDPTQSDKYNLIVRQSSSEQKTKAKKDRIYSSPMRANIDLASGKLTMTQPKDRRKMNRDRVASEIYTKANRDIPIEEFLEPSAAEESVSETNDSPDIQPHKGIKNSPGYSRAYKMKVNESCENLEDDHDEESISNKGKEGSKTFNTLKAFNHTYGTTRSRRKEADESVKLKDEVESMRSENRKILEQLKEMQKMYSKAEEHKQDYEQSLLNEIKLLKSKIGDEESSKTSELEFEVRSNVDAKWPNLTNMRRESDVKRLPDFESDRGYGNSTRHMWKGSRGLDG